MMWSASCEKSANGTTGFDFDAHVILPSPRLDTGLGVG